MSIHKKFIPFNFHRTVQQLQVLKIDIHKDKKIHKSCMLHSVSTKNQ